MKTYGLIGKTLSHSFSKKYFSEKFEREKLPAKFELFELSDIKQFPELLKEQEIAGLSVTIPYKEQIIPYLDAMDESAAGIGAVNVIKLSKGKAKGFNSDYYGFLNSLKSWLHTKPMHAFILGNGGAAKAVRYALHHLDINSTTVSRSNTTDTISYEAFNTMRWPETMLVVNTSPLGTYPNVAEAPDIAYEKLTEKHALYDLVYNPERTQFLKNGETKGAKIKNGLEMLHQQAEKAWEIWNS